MQGLNRVFLLGRLGRDPQQYTDRTGKNFVTLNLATERSWYSEENQKRESHTDWHSIMVRGGRADLCTRFLTKGSPVMVEGYLSTYETQTERGDRKWNVSIHADKVTFLPSNFRKDSPFQETKSETTLTESFEN